ncbi:epoxide hydrolase [Chitinophaga sp. Mgbs1]|uniref:Epoxide hydrolase n=1 Tax=Chitinophaga solisilvae TaxID=1233460 RepID=A0A3S1B3L6_9BACT|nr:epoxide hydrolase [Chitinophaga solisilvae]
MKQVQPFSINIPQNILDELQVRLKHTRLPDEKEGSGWEYGANLAYMKDLMHYWEHSYNWREQEAAMNKFSHFTADVKGTQVHFIHEKGKGPNPIPLILTHGWPDSFYRFLKIIPMLTDPEKYGGRAEDSFDVIIPSVPGFGFSEKIALSQGPVADLWASLMTETLGYDRFMAAGGDLGTGVVKELANRYPQHVTAIHLTDVGYPNGTENWAEMSPAEQQFGQYIQHWWMTEGAYNMIQSTKPQTIAYALTDSPSGLAAWFIEKFYTWSACKDNLDSHFSKDELLTNIMIYWVTGTAGSAARMYLEVARSVYMNPAAQPAKRVEVPTAFASFPGDAPVPREWAERQVNLQRHTIMPEGGHFSAWEKPTLYANDIRAFAQSFR